jgi:BirA family biotin operon repressor/biotin-[acetyl-CoA-carboxylase] ligase
MGCYWALIEFRPHYFESLPSTQVLAKDWINAKKYQPYDVIIAYQQTAGYGRRGRHWQSPRGNFSATFILPFEQHSMMQWLGFAFGLALYETAGALTVGQLQLKWPNDLLLDQAKLSGLLIEIAEPCILVGVGVNLVAAPPSDQPTAHLTSATSPEDFFIQCMPHVSYWLEQGYQDGFKALRQHWLDRSQLSLHKQITARLADGTIYEGKFVDLDPSGALVLQTSTAIHHLTAADIYTNVEK